MKPRIRKPTQARLQAARRFQQPIPTSPTAPADKTPENGFTAAAGPTEKETTMSEHKYAALDAAICKHIAEGRGHVTNSSALEAIARPLLAINKTPFPVAGRLIDRRMQAMRKDGQLVYERTKGGGHGRWRVRGTAPADKTPENGSMAAAGPTDRAMDNPIIQALLTDLMDGAEIEVQR